MERKVSVKKIFQSEISCSGPFVNVVAGKYSFRQKCLKSLRVEVGGERLGAIVHHRTKIVGLSHVVAVCRRSTLKVTLGALRKLKLQFSMFFIKNFVQTLQKKKI